MIYQQRLVGSTQHFELVNGSSDVSLTFGGVGLEDKYTSAMAGYSISLHWQTLLYIDFMLTIEQTVNYRN